MSRGIGTIVFICQVLVIVEAWGVEHKDVRHAASAQWVFTMPGRTPIAMGDFAEVRRIYAVAPSNRYILRLACEDDYFDFGYFEGYRFKEILVDGEVVWEQDVAGGKPGMQSIEVDVTGQVKGKASVTVVRRRWRWCDTISPSAAGASPGVYRCGGGRPAL